MQNTQMYCIFKHLKQDIPTYSSSSIFIALSNIFSFSTEVILSFIYISTHSYVVSMQH